MHLGLAVRPDALPQALGSIFTAGPAALDGASTVADALHVHHGLDDGGAGGL